MIGVVVCGINVASDFQNIKLFLLFAKPGTFAEYFVVSKVKTCHGDCAVPSKLRNWDGINFFFILINELII